MNTTKSSKAVFIFSLFIISLMTPLANVGAQNTDGITIIHTEINPANNNTYHLLSASSWDDAASAARGLDGFLVTINDEAENSWIYETFGNYDNQSRHLWTGLSDNSQEGYYKWHDGTPFHYRNWGQNQPSSGGDEDYVHIAGTNIGNIMPGSWNDLENDPQYFPVYAVVEIGPGADYALRFDGVDDYLISDEEMPDWDGHIEIEAMVNMPDTSGINFIAMMGDYGWGLYINNGYVAYSNEYSMSNNPTSNITITENNWTNVKVVIEENSYGTFYIDGIEAGSMEPEQAKIPSGDFGSNDCFQSGSECDELIIGKMGAGCDCNYFMGLLDDVIINNAGNETAWMFPEGEGMNTSDYTGRLATINGASWVMPDGSIVTQAIQIFNGEDISGISGMPGDQILFFAEIDEMTKSAYFTAFEKFDESFFDEDISFDVYVGHEYIPNSWEYDLLLENQWGYMSEGWDWPAEGTWWFVIVPNNEIESLTINLNWNVADPPPPLEDMIQLINGIPITDQSISGGRQVPLEDKLLYYYVEVTENLSSLSVETYDGTGNVDLAMSWGTVPDPFDFGFENFLIDEMDSGQEVNVKTSFDGGPGNNQNVILYDIEPGIYYITAYTYQRASDFTISAKLTYQPENIEPEDAIELSPGISYGPLSGYKNLKQYFKINVPIGTERLEVDLSKGFGEASLFMKIEQAPTSADFTYLSSSPGAGDKIAFNSPTPGMWYILLDTDEVFGELFITASFEDKYTWSYDGTPIELFNGEEVLGIEAPKGEELFFFTNLEKPGEYLQISTFGGSGDLLVNVKGKKITFAFDGFFNSEDNEMGRQGRPMDTESEDIDLNSNGDGTVQSVYISLPANGRFDISLTAVSEISDITIIAKWVYSDFIEPIDEVPNIEPVADKSCRDVANDIMQDTDTNKNGLIEYDEFSKSIYASENFNETDLNDDGNIEFAEVLQESCSCDNEIMLIFDQLSNNGNSVSIELMSSQIYENKYNLLGMDTNSDQMISTTEIEIMSNICDTTFDAFDGDGDGVPDVDDEFPNDPNEFKDTDGDGVGDNSDIAPSVANDLVYSIGAIVFIGLLALLVVFARGSRSDINSNSWTEEKKFDIAETMLGMQDLPTPKIQDSEISSNNGMYPNEVNEIKSTSNFEAGNIYQESEMIQSPVSSMITDSSFEDLLESNIPIQAPSSQLMGMIGSDGKESIEYPINSGVKWTRGNPSQDWIKFD